MRVIVVGADPLASAVVAALDGEGIDVARPPEGGTASGRASELSALAAELLEFESLLTGEGPDAVVVTDVTDRCLAAVVAATKLPVPVGFLAGGEEPDALNARLIARLADTSIAGGPGSAVSWVQALMP